MKIVLMMAVTADGLIARTSDHFPDWTCSADKKLFQSFSKECGVILMGKNTFKTLSGPLPGRLNVVFSQEKGAEQEGVRWVSGPVSSVVEQLSAEGYQQAVLGGGRYLNTLFLRSGLVDEVWLTIEPRIFGRGLSLFNDDFDVKLALIEVSRLNQNTVHLKYKVIYD